jgi:O-antigen/teichoic acid export membrane protein
MSQTPPQPPSQGPVRDDDLSVPDVKAKAVRGVVTVGVRGLAIRGIGMVSNVVLARLLLPSDFGVLALGFTCIAVAGFITSGGIGAHFIRAPEPPSRRQLEAVYGLQLTAACALAIITATIGIPLGDVGAVAAVMACSLPIDATRAPAALLAERRLDYTALVRAEVLEILAYNAVAITLVALGAGVWGVAIAVVVRAIVGTTLIVLTLPPGVVRPRWSWSTVRPILGFGLAFQSISAVTLVRDQGIVVLTGAVAGLTTLGYWSLAYRIVQVVVVVLESLWRVSFPAVARLIAADDDVAPTLQRALRIAGVIVGAIVAGLIGSAPASIPLVFGSTWDSAVPAVAFCAAGLMISGPLSTASAGLLLARGRVSWVLWATIAHTVTWFAVATPLMPTMGAEGVGIGWCAAAGVDAALLARYTTREIQVPIIVSVASPTIAAAGAAAIGWWLATEIEGALAGSIAATGTVAIVYPVLRAVMCPHDLRDTYDVLRRGLRRAPDASADLATVGGP